MAQTSRLCIVNASTGCHAPHNRSKTMATHPGHPSNRPQKADSHRCCRCIMGALQGGFSLGQGDKQRMQACPSLGAHNLQPLQLQHLHLMYPGFHCLLLIAVLICSVMWLILSGACSPSILLTFSRASILSGLAVTATSSIYLACSGPQPNNVSCVLSSVDETEVHLQLRPRHQPSSYSSLSVLGLIAVCFDTNWCSSPVG